MTHYIVQPHPHLTGAGNEFHLSDASPAAETFVGNDLIVNYSQDNVPVSSFQDREVVEEGIVYAYQDEHGSNTMYVISQVLDENGQLVNVAIPVEATSAAEDFTPDHEDTAAADTGTPISVAVQNVPEVQVMHAASHNTPVAVTTVGTSSFPGPIAINGDNYTIKSENYVNDEVLEPTTEITVQEEGGIADTPVTTTEFQLVQNGNRVIVKSSDGNIINEFALPEEREVKVKVETMDIPSITVPLSTPRKPAFIKTNSVPSVQQPTPKIVLVKQHNQNKNPNLHKQRLQFSSPTPAPKIRVMPSGPLNRLNCASTNFHSTPRKTYGARKIRPIVRTAPQIATSSARPQNQKSNSTAKSCKILIKSETLGNNSSTSAVTLIVRQEIPESDAADRNESSLSTPKAAPTQPTLNHFGSNSIEENCDNINDEIDLVGLPYSYGGQSFNLQSQKLILNVYDFFRKTSNIRLKRSLPKGNPQEQASAVLNVSSSVIGKIRKRYNEGKLELSPNCSQKLGFKRVLDQVDENDEEMIRDIISDFSNKGITPNIPVLLQEARDRIGFMGSRTSFRRILQRMGFKYAKDKNKKTVILFVKEQEEPSFSKTSISTGESLTMMSSISNSASASISLPPLILSSSFYPTSEAEPCPVTINSTPRPTPCFAISYPNNCIASAAATKNPVLSESTAISLPQINNFYISSDCYVQMEPEESRLVNEEVVSTSMS